MQYFKAVCGAIAPTVQNPSVITPDRVSVAADKETSRCTLMTTPRAFVSSEGFLLRSLGENCPLISLPGEWGHIQTSLQSLRCSICGRKMEKVEQEVVLANLPLPQKI